jgi:hypothetical protein
MEISKVLSFFSLIVISIFKPVIVKKTLGSKKPPGHLKLSGWPEVSKKKIWRNIL